MSGTPKYNNAAIAAEQKERLRQERERKAALEAKRRAEAEERERKRRLEALRRGLLDRATKTVANLHAGRVKLRSDDFAKLDGELRQTIARLQNGVSEHELTKIASSIPKIETAIAESIAAKRREDEEKQIKAEMDKLRYSLSELKKRLDGVSKDDIQKFDPEGYKSAVKSIDNASIIMQRGDPVSSRASLTEAMKIAQHHMDAVASGKAQWERNRVDAERACGEIHAIILGLNADEVAMRWKSDDLRAMEKFVSEAELAIREERFNSVHDLMKAAEDRQGEIIEESNELQLKADQRDYIAKSMASTLQSMGFYVGDIREESPGNPASPLVFGAARSAGKSVFVSVPVEGEIYYNMDGYPKTSANVIGGGVAPVCDEAEIVLNEMRSLLVDSYGVETDEVRWEGKTDPDRILRTADELPTNSEKPGGMESQKP